MSAPQKKAMYMPFRVVELASSASASRRTAFIEVKVFDSAYAAVDFITAAWHRNDARAARLCLVDGYGQVLLGPMDMYESYASRAANQ